MPPETNHILAGLQSSLDALKEHLRLMGEKALLNLNHAAQGLLDRNTDLCNRAIADDEQVDELEKEIDREGVDLILKYSPMGRDLRRVISSMKAAQAIERISDHAVALARRAKSINQHTPVPETEQLRRLFQLASDQLRSALQSLCDGDLTAALSIQGRDAELDATYREYNKIVMAKMQADPGQIPDYVDMLFCSRFLERVGDQSVNIAEDAIYLLTAQDVRHGGTLNNPS